MTPFLLNVSGNCPSRVRVWASIYIFFNPDTSLFKTFISSGGALDHLVDLFGYVHPVCDTRLGLTLENRVPMLHAYQKTWERRFKGPNIKKFTEKGFEVTRTPKNLFNKILKFRNEQDDAKKWVRGKKRKKMLANLQSLFSPLKWFW